MRRAILTLGGTAAGLAALLSFKTHTSVADVADPGVAPDRLRLRRRRARRLRRSSTAEGEGEDELEGLAGRR